VWGYSWPMRHRARDDRASEDMSTGLRSKILTPTSVGGRT
jgi:hypothetical protein